MYNVVKSYNKMDVQVEEYLSAVFEEVFEDFNVKARNSVHSYVYDNLDFTDMEKEAKEYCNIL